MKMRSIRGCISLLALIGLIFIGPNVRAGQTSHDAVVRIHSTQKTLRQLAAAVTEQTGIPIKFPTAIRERRLTVGAVGVPLRSLLDSICETEGWSWRLADTGPGVIIDMPTAGLKPGESVYAALRRQTPPDLVSYWRLPPADKYSQGSGPGIDLKDRQRELSKRLSDSLVEDAATLVSDGLQLSQLKADQREMALLAAIGAWQGMRAFGEFALNSDLMKVRPEGTSLRMEQKTILMIGFQIDGQNGAFGANTASP